MTKAEAKKAAKWVCGKALDQLVEGGWKYWKYIECDWDDPDTNRLSAAIDEEIDDLYRRSGIGSFAEKATGNTNGKT